MATLWAAGKPQNSSLWLIISIQEPRIFYSRSVTDVRAGTTWTLDILDNIDLTWIYISHYKIQMRTLTRYTCDDHCTLNYHQGY